MSCFFLRLHTEPALTSVSVASHPRPPSHAPVGESSAAHWQSAFPAPNLAYPPSTPALVATRNKILFRPHATPLPRGNGEEDSAKLHLTPPSESFTHGNGGEASYSRALFVSLPRDTDMVDFLNGEENKKEYDELVPCAI